VTVRSNRILTLLFDALAGQVISTLLSELGEARLHHIAAISPSPLSVASIAQVHTATLTDGTRVVLKLQHVEVEMKMLQDLQQAERLATTLAWVEPQVDLRALLEEMVRTGYKRTHRPDSRPLHAPSLTAGLA
jgi:predicted unusual protein kinase regulating ubiquinone biosynthesis (AarF/ABC1/UbiB family)